MSRKPKYNYDIKLIEQGESYEEGEKGFSVREIARQNDWPEENTQQWIHRNYPRKEVRYFK